MSIEEIVKFKTDRGLDKQPYNALNEHTNIIEELLESIGLDVPKEKREQLKDEFHHFTNMFGFELGLNQLKNPTNEDKVDAYGDVIVFAIGAILKLNYDPDKVLSEISKEINSRVGEMVNGKFEKDLSPEAKSNWYKANFENCKRGK
jgi:hypothetical protein